MQNGMYLKRGTVQRDSARLDSLTFIRSPFDALQNSFPVEEIIIINGAQMK